MGLEEDGVGRAAGAELAELVDELRRRTLIAQDLAAEGRVGEGPVRLVGAPEAAPDLLLERVEPLLLGRGERLVLRDDGRIRGRLEPSGDVVGADDEEKPVGRLDRRRSPRAERRRETRRRLHRQPSPLQVHEHPCTDRAPVTGIRPVDDVRALVTERAGDLVAELPDRNGVPLARDVGRHGSSGHQSGQREEPHHRHGRDRAPDSAPRQQ